MVSSFYNLTEFFNRISLAHPNVTTFTFGNLDDIDFFVGSIKDLRELVEIRCFGNYYLRVNT
jgi:hypothetical protein